MSRVELDYASVGPSAAARTVVVLREGASATSDPDSAVTRRRDVRVVAVRVDAEEVAEPGGFGGQTAGEVTVEALSTLVAELVPDSGFGLVGVGGAADSAVRLAIALADRVDRLVLIAAPEPETPLERDDAESVLADVRAKTLIMNGQKDPDAAAAAAEWHRAHIASARVEMVPFRDGAADPRLSLGAVWERVLSFSAPRTSHSD